MDAWTERRYRLDMATEIDGQGEREERIDAAIDRIREGEAAIVAVARGETVDPDLLDRAADELAGLLGRGVTASWSLEDVEHVRRLRALVMGGPPSPEARAPALGPHALCDHRPAPGVTAAAG